VFGRRGRRGSSGNGGEDEWAFGALAWKAGGLAVDIWQGPGRRGVSGTFRGETARSSRCEGGSRGGVQYRGLNCSRRRRSARLALLLASHVVAVVVVMAG